MVFYQSRPALMSSIRSRNNKGTELRLLSILKRMRISGWRRHVRLPGRPDFAFRQERLAIFIDGCFWHGCPRCYKEPRENRAFWKMKMVNNRARDCRVTQELRARGWTVL